MAYLAQNTSGETVSTSFDGLVVADPTVKFGP